MDLIKCMREIVQEGASDATVTAEALSSVLGVPAGDGEALLSLFNALMADCCGGDSSGHGSAAVSTASTWKTALTNAVATVEAVDLRPLDEEVTITLRGGDRPAEGECHTVIGSVGGWGCGSRNPLAGLWQ